MDTRQTAGQNDRYQMDSCLDIQILDRQPDRQIDTRQTTRQIDTRQTVGQIYTQILQIDNRIDRQILDRQLDRQIYTRHTAVQTDRQPERRQQNDRKIDKCKKIIKVHNSMKLCELLNTYIEREREREGNRKKRER